MFLPSSGAAGLAARVAMAPKTMHLKHVPGQRDLFGRSVAPDSPLPVALLTPAEAVVAKAQAAAWAAKENGGSGGRGKGSGKGKHGGGGGRGNGSGKGNRGGGAAAKAATPKTKVVRKRPASKIKGEIKKQTVPTEEIVEVPRAKIFKAMPATLNARPQEDALHR